MDTYSISVFDKAVKIFSRAYSSDLASRVICWGKQYLSCKAHE